jgi:hypothetical protein
MHPSEEAHAILSLFDGEIGIEEKEIAGGTRRILKIKRLIGKKYLEDQFELSKDKLGH